jgi:hypothetical protein
MTHRDNATAVRQLSRVARDRRTGHLCERHCVCCGGTPGATRPANPHRLYGTCACEIAPGSVNHELAILTDFAVSVPCDAIMHKSQRSRQSLRPGRTHFRKRFVQPPACSRNPRIVAATLAITRYGMNESCRRWCCDCLDVPLQMTSLVGHREPIFRHRPQPGEWFSSRLRLR